jgi:SNF2-related domain
VLDYASLLALKSPSGEARVLVVCPLVAVDTWVLQARTFVSPQVSWWAEALGGSISLKASALASRGVLTPGRPSRRSHGPARGQSGHPRAEGTRRAVAWAASEEIDPRTGPGALPTPRLVLEVVNVDAFASRYPFSPSRTMADLMVDAVRRFEPDLVVIDESHRIKSASGNASRALARLVPFVRRRMILTGTVMPHSPLDVYGQWRFLDPTAFTLPQPDGTRRPMSFTRFKEHYAIVGGYLGYEVLGFRRLDEMQDVMARLAVVARKSECLDLPPTTDVVIPVELGAAEKRAYREMKQALATQLSTGALATVPNRLAQLLRLRQITAGHLPDDQDNVVTIGESKARTIRSLVHDTLAGEKRVVVFAYFTAEIAQLRTLLNEPGTEVLAVDGTVKEAERTAIRTRFGSSDPTRLVLVAQVRTMSLAVNELVTANHAVFASLSQQRDDFEQAKARLDRQGQTKPVTFWYCLAPHTVDEVIYHSHQDRTDLEDAMLRHVKGAV